jgi:2,4-dienoyl-CoA reductase-like NADH-dependent reductase (Old Yellow Enzyme family)
MLAGDSKPSMLLREPGRIGPLLLKNRVVMGPMGTNFGTSDGFSTERDKIYYAERARGGAAMIITEAMVVSGNARNHRASLCIFDDRFIPGLADLTNARSVRPGRWRRAARWRRHDRIRLRTLCHPLCDP